MAFVESVFGEALQQIEDAVGLMALDIVFQAARDEIFALRLHLFPDLLTHGAAEQIRLTEAEARKDLRGLHHLFLVDDDAKGLAQDRLELGMDIIRLLHAVLARAICRDVRHGAGPIKRDQRDDVFEAIRPHVEERTPHTRTFQLEDADGFRAGQQVVSAFVIEGDRGKIDVDAAPFHQRNGRLQDRERFQAEEIELHEACLLHPFHVELGNGHVGFRIAVERHKL